MCIKKAELASDIVYSIALRHVQAIIKKAIKQKRNYFKIFAANLGFMKDCVYVLIIFYQH